MFVRKRLKDKNNLSNKRLKMDLKELIKEDERLKKCTEYAGWQGTKLQGIKQSVEAGDNEDKEVTSIDRDFQILKKLMELKEKQG